jgi:hypothetical protein
MTQLIVIFGQYVVWMQQTNGDVPDSCSLKLNQGEIHEQR